ncbi:spindle pole body formation-associated protein-domain-containing protein [Xylariaceae sp. FL0662B]|nr:spindle pole body formation-associated protein-domain-containing protein [Xylariaceae sp. FL0662B]
MLGWALRRGFQGATGGNDAPNGGEDTTQIDAPDTPAPVFAARAIRNAIFGASNAPEPAASNNEKRDEAVKVKTTDDATPDDLRSPSKPTSILLTPGTGTARRKRVSFGHDVKDGNAVDSSPLASASNRQRHGRTRTTLQQALENSRSIKSEKAAQKAVQEATALNTGDGDSEDGWEDDVCNHDVTVDLNEPHSESGKFWKSEFDRYRDEAKSDIERLVKFKALAKSFAKKKDAEALELAQKLKEEQAKMIKMEEKVAEMAVQVAGKRKHGSDGDHASLMKDLSKQTALAIQYRDQVNDLEDLLKETQGNSGSHRSDRRRINTSPRTEQTLLEVNRELRRARSELKQMDKLREEVRQLKSDLKAAYRQAKSLEKADEETTDSSQISRLEKQLRDAKEESRQKDSELRKLKRDYESLKRDAKARTAEAMEVLYEKNERIAELEKTIKALETTNISRSRTKDLDKAIAKHNTITRDLKSGIESLSKPSKYEKARPARHPRRSVSVEDITLDMTQRSLLASKDEGKVDNITRERQHDHDRPFSSDLTASLFDIEEQPNAEKKERIEARKRERGLIMEDSDVAPPQQIPKTKGALPSSSSRRVMSDLPSSRVNEPSPKDSISHRHGTAKESIASDYHQNKMSQRDSMRAGSFASEKAVTHGTLEKPAVREGSKSNTSRPRSPSSEAPRIDLVQDRFARLGGTEAERTGSVNSSRCTLPADRQAAARARLQQKKMERQKASGGVLDKENIKP